MIPCKVFTKIKTKKGKRKDLKVKFQVNFCQISFLWNPIDNPKGGPKDHKKKEDPKS